MTKPAASSAADIVETRAAEWIVARHVRDDWDQHKQAALEQWLAQSPAHTIAYLRLDGAWDRTARLKALSPPKHRFTLRTILPGLLPTLAKSVAALAVIAIGAYLVSDPERPRERTYATALGGHDVLKLPDGSHVELDTDTVLRVSLTNKRQVWLDKGQAYFQIAHDPHHPFTVTAANRKVTVLGTKFLMRQDPKRLDVAVMEGKVRLEASEGAAQQRSAILTLGDEVVATASGMTVTRKTPQARARAMAWRRGLLVFDQATLQDAALELNRYNARKLVIADANTAALIIGGTFRTNDVESFTRLVGQILHVEITTRGNDIILSQKHIGG